MICFIWKHWIIRNVVPRLLQKMHYNPDGTIQEVPYWQETKLEQIENFNPYRRVEAETMAWGYGLKTGKS